MSEPKPKTWEPFIVAALFMCALIFLVPTAFDIIQFGQKCISYPYQLDPEEGFLLVQAMELSEGKTFYRELNNYPYMAGTYAPIYQSINAFLMKFSSPGFASGRILSFVSALAILILGIWIIYVYTKNIIVSITCPLLYFNSYEVCYWIGFYRVDFLSILFSVVGIAILFDKQTGKYRPYVAGFMFLLAGYTKQVQQVAALSAVMYFLFVHRKTAWQIMSVWLGLGGVIFLVSNVLTKGQFFKHTVLFNANEFDWLALKHLLLGHLQIFYLYMIILSVLCVIYYFSWRITNHLVQKRKSAVQENFLEEMDVETAPQKTIPEKKKELSDIDPYGFFVVYFIFNLLYVVGVAKKGATVNYFIEPLFAASLLIGITMGRIIDARYSAGMHPSFRWPTFAIFCALLIVHAEQLNRDWPPMNPVYKKKVLTWSEQMKRGLGGIYSKNIASKYAARLMTENQDEEIFCEHPVINVLAKYPTTHIFQTFIMSRLAREGKWDQTQFVSDLGNGRFKYLILTVDISATDKKTGNNLYTAEMIRAMDSRYMLERSINEGLWTYFFYERKPISEKERREYL